MKLKAKPEQESFIGKYENKGLISTYLVNKYFQSVNKLIKQISNKKLENSLEIGCGEGYSTLKLSEILPKNIKLEASEYVEKQVYNAKQKNPNITIIQEDIYNLKRDINSIDLIFLLEVLEHLDHPEIALDNIKQITSSSGYLILGVPREPLWRILNICRLKYLKHLGNTPGHLNHWSKSSIVKFAEKHFGKIVAIESPLPWTILLIKK